MKLCSACSRHYWETEACCPFCGPESWGGTSTVATVLGVTLAAGVALLSCTEDKGGPTTTDNGGSYYAGPTTTDIGTTTEVGTTVDDNGGSYYAGPSTDDFDSSGSSTTTDGTTTDGGGSYYAGPSTDDFGTSTSGATGTSSGTGMG